MTILLIYIIHDILLSGCVGRDVKSICHMRFHDFLEGFQNDNKNQS